MYGFSGGCTTLFHLAVRHPIIVLAFGIAGFVTQIPANPRPGDALGTEHLLTQVEKALLKEHPQLPDTERNARSDFIALGVQDVGDQRLSRVLDVLESCPDLKLSDLNLVERTEIAFLFYLDWYGRDGPKKAGEILKNNSPPRTQKR